MASLFDVFGRLLLEDGGKQFVASAKKAGEQAGDQAGKSMGQRVASNLKSALSGGARVLAGGAAAAFGIATKGALELENATARYRAETGATADEAVAMGKVINRVAGDQRQSLESVTEVAIRVKRDMGAIGEEAAKLTAQFVAFARVTRQDAGGAVSAFDDILDSWGLSAGEAGITMDKLLVSQQRFGGVLTDTQATLAALAPAFRAANFQIDDAISLLGLFGSKGIDANVGAAAFAKALTKVKSPEELKALIADISATVDPFDRARKAADLFGAKAGAKLANALAGAKLDDYTISVEDAAGATEHAADVLDSTFSAQLQKRISQAGAALRQFGSDVGPAVTGLASLASLGGSLGLDRLLGKAFGKLAGSALVKGAASKAGFFIGTVFSGAMFLGDKLGGALAGAFNKLPGSGAVKGAMQGAGKLLGGGLGTALAAAFAVVAVAEVVATYNRIKGELEAQGKAIGESVAQQIKQGTLDELQQSKAALEEGIQNLSGVMDLGLFSSDARKNLQAQLDAVDAAIAAKAAQIPGTVQAELAGGAPKVKAGAADMVDDIDGEVTAAGVDAARAAAKTPQEIADGLRSGRDAVQQAIAQLHNDITNQLTRTQEAAGLAGTLTGKELAAGLHSKDPVVTAQAEATTQVVIDRLVALAEQGGPLGKKAMDKLNAGIRSKNPQVRAAAAAAKAAVEAKLNAIKATAAGHKAGEGLRTGILDKENRIGNAVWTVGTRIVRNLLGGILYAGGGRASKDDRIERRAWGGPVEAHRAYLVNENTPNSEIFVPDVPGTIMPSASEVHTTGGGAGSMGDTYNIDVQLEGAPPAHNPLEVARQLAWASRQGMLKLRPAKR
jgi:hypothetical protein